MKILVFYDIIETKTRNQIIDLLEDYSFQRVQLSAFLGEISRKKVKRLTESANNIIDKEKDSFYVFTLSEKDFNNCTFLGKVVNKKFFNEPFLIF